LQAKDFRISLCQEQEGSLLDQSLPRARMKHLGSVLAESKKKASRISPCREKKVKLLGSILAESKR
jgi:hypothetical protein